MNINGVTEAVGLCALGLVMCFAGLFVAVKKSNHYEKRNSSFPNHRGSL
jgi:hypothetical protein